MDKFDDIYKLAAGKVSDFVFDEKVVDVFQNMINRSVPHYAFVVNMTGEISKKFVQNGSNCYDLGSALGASTFSVLQNNLDKNFQIFAVDNSEAMIEKSRIFFEKFRAASKNVSVEFVLSDIDSVDFHNASFVVLNFTLQFVSVEKRTQLIQKIFDGMNKGGALFVSEKIKFADAHEELFNDEMHLAFKKLNGYSDLEISQKRTALEKVLIKETFEEHESRLKEVGFIDVYKWFQCFNFVSFVAVK